jgi:hypothetical protein
MLHFFPQLRIQKSACVHGLVISFRGNAGQFVLDHGLHRELEKPLQPDVEFFARTLDGGKYRLRNVSPEQFLVVLN